MKLLNLHLWGILYKSQNLNLIFYPYNYSKQSLYKYKSCKVITSDDEAL